MLTKAALGVAWLFVEPRVGDVGAEKLGNGGACVPRQQQYSSINSQGAQLSAEGNALLHAKNNINLGFATDSHSQTADGRRSGFAIDNRDHLSPAGVYHDKNQGAGALDKATGTLLSVGGQSTLQTDSGDINILGSTVAVSEPNLLNVAATRAKRRFYVIGDWNDWQNRALFCDVMDLLPQQRLPDCEATLTV